MKEKIEKLSKILMENEHTKNLVDLLVEVEEKYKNKKLTIGLIGEFSAGKTSLINSIFKVKLPTNITPETAAVWQIQLGDKEEIKVVFKNDETKIVNNVEEIKQFDPKEIFRIYVTINSKDYEDIIFLDTPGLSSLTPAHLSALLSAIDDMDVIFVVVDISQPSLTKSVVEFLKKHSKTSDEIYLILSKADKIPPKKSKEAVEYIKKTFDFVKKVVVTSSKNNRIKDLKVLIKELMKKNEELLLKKANEELKDVCKKIVTDIENTKNMFKTLPATTDILKLRQEITKYRDTLMRKKEEIGARIRNIFIGNFKNFESRLRFRFNKIAEDFVRVSGTAENFNTLLVTAFQEEFQNFIQNIEIELNQNIPIHVTIDTDSISQSLSLETLLVEFKEYIVNIIYLITKFIPTKIDDAIGMFIIKIAEKFLDSFVTDSIKGELNNLINNIIFDLRREINSYINRFINAQLQDLETSIKGEIEALEEKIEKLNKETEKHEEVIKKLEEVKVQVESICYQ